MTHRRVERVSQAIKREVSDLLQRRIKDRRVGSGMTTVTRVVVSDDLRYAKVYVSVYGTADDRRVCMEALWKATPFVRRELAGRLGLRFAPEVTFKLDESLEKGDRVLRLLREVADEARRKAASDEGREGEGG